MTSCVKPDQTLILVYTICLDFTVRILRISTVLQFLDFLATVKAAPHESVNRTGLL